MHYVLALLSAVAGAAYWWYRLKMVNDAAADITNAVGKVRANLRRRKFRNKAALSPVAAIDHPVIAAATMLYAIANEVPPVKPKTEKAITDILIRISDAETLQEAIIYAKWATSKIAEASTVIDVTGKFLASRLSEGEKAELIEMANQIEQMRPDWRPAHSKNLRRLRQKLGLQLD